ncbi:MAG TPA: hypothetical protein VLA60_05775 [Nitrospirales bacterium]|nr:hypothetical protein [Nitrospirales bacterium]
MFTRPDSRDAPHLFGLGIIEMLADEISQDLRQTRDQAIAKAKGRRQSVEVSLKSKGISYGNIRVNPDGSVDPSRLEGGDEDLGYAHFFIMAAPFPSGNLLSGHWMEKWVWRL